MKKTKILIADDHSVVRDGLRSLLAGSKEFHIVAEASSGTEALELASKLLPDVAIVDISMPVMNGVELTRALKRNNPAVKVLILTIHESEDYVELMVREGANGYVLKNAERQELFSAIRAVVAGEPFFSPAISKLMVGSFIKQAKGESKPASLPLTKRELEVLRFIAQSLTNKEIAEKLFLSVTTVNTHRTNLMKKLKIHDTAGLVRYVLQQGLDKPQS